MIKYTIVDKENPIFPQYISQQDFEILEKFHPIFLKFSNIINCSINFELSKNELLNFIDSTCKKPISSLEPIYPKMNFLFFSNILFGRIFIDNIKSLLKQLKLDNEIINEFESRNEFEMMRVLRDFGQHFSSPIIDMSITTSFDYEKQILDIYTEKSELERNTETSLKNKKYIKKIEKDKIALMPYFNSWCNSIDELFSIILDKFYKTISKKVMQLLQKYFISYEDTRNKFVEIQPNSIQKIEKSNKTFTSDENVVYNVSKTLDSFRFQRNTIVYLLSKYSSV